MERKEFLDAIKATYECEPLEENEGLKLNLDGFFGDIDVTVVINSDDTFNFNICVLTLIAICVMMLMNRVFLP